VPATNQLNRLSSGQVQGSSQRGAKLRTAGLWLNRLPYGPGATDGMVAPPKSHRLRGQRSVDILLADEPWTLIDRVCTPLAIAAVPCLLRRTVGKCQYLDTCPRH
jgi:hypothetical protein